MTTTIVPVVGNGVGFTQQGVGTTPGYSAIDLRRAANQGTIQEGVNAGPNAYVVFQRAAGANMSVDIGAYSVESRGDGGGAYVQGDAVYQQGLYFVAEHGAANLNEVIATADATNPRVDQVILEVLDNVHDASGSSLARTRVLTGTPTAGATLANRTGAAALPGSAIRLADVLVGAAASSITNAVIRDRRPFARGAYSRYVRTAGAYTTASTSLVEIDTTNMKPRIECTGNPVRIRLVGYGSPSVAASVSLGLFMDGAGIDGSTILASQNYASSANGLLVMEYIAVPAAGSHTFSPTFATSAGTLTLAASSTSPLQFTVEEIVRPSEANNLVTSG